MVGPIKRKDPTAPQQPPTPGWDCHPSSPNVGCGTGGDGMRPRTGGAPGPWASSGCSAAHSWDKRTPRHRARVTNTGERLRRSARKDPDHRERDRGPAGTAFPGSQERDTGGSWIGQQQIFLHFFLFPDPSHRGEVILLFCRLKQRFQNPRLLFLSANLKSNPGIFHVKRAGIPLKDSLNNNSYMYSNEIQNHLKCCSQEKQIPRASGNPGAACRLFLGSV